MTLEKFKIAIKDKTFRSSVGDFIYRFIPENTLQVNGNMANSVHYSIGGNDDEFIFNHNNLFGSEPYIIEVNTTNTGLFQLTLKTQFTNVLKDIWTQV
ncbi:hypothetical protein [Sphingobacterium siyangense]|nr:hypothetical protein [Sphingobacterium siyangense]